MNDAQAHQAPQVCHTCKTRKKGCDKKLPRCGYCTSRNIRCKYDKLASSGSGNASSLGNEIFRSWNPAKTIDRNATVNAATPTGRPAVAASVLEPQPASGMECTSLTETVWTLLRRDLASFKLSLTSLLDKFSEGINSWLPIISLEQLRNTLHDHDKPPFPDVSVLLLAMLLLTVQPQSPHSHTTPADLKRLYRRVRSHFSDVQTELCASVHLIQAGCLIATYEHACGRHDSAYTSIGLCSRMCHVAGLDQHKEAARSTYADLKLLEKRNTWWGVIILERWVLLDHLHMTGIDTNPGKLFSNQHTVGGIQ